MRVFLDTNILLDVLLGRLQFIAGSEKVILRCENLEARMFIAWLGLATAYYLLKRGRTEDDALIEVDEILAWARVAETSDFHAREARWLGCNDFEDALQIAAATACGADCVVTRNKTDFAVSSVSVFTPTEFLGQFSAV